LPPGGGGSHDDRADGDGDERDPGRFRRGPGGHRGGSAKGAPGGEGRPHPHPRGPPGRSQGISPARGETSPERGGKGMTGLDARPLAASDPEIARLIALEARRQEEGLELIASENFASRAVRQAMGSVLTHKYAEG